MTLPINVIFSHLQVRCCARDCLIVQWILLGYAKLTFISLFFILHRKRHA